MITALMNSDCRCRGLMFRPDAQDLANRINIAIMRCQAVRTFPASFPKHTYSFRTSEGNVPAARSRLGGVSLIRFNKHGFVLSGHVAEHVPRRPPACEHGLSQPHPGEAGGVHNAGDDQTILSRNPCGSVVVVASGIGDPRTDRLDPLPVASPLRDSAFRVVFPLKRQGRDFADIEQRDEIFQAKVNTNTVMTGGQAIPSIAAFSSVWKHNVLPPRPAWRGFQVGDYR